MIEAIHAIRSLKKELSIQRQNSQSVLVECKSDAAELLKRHAADIEFLCKIPRIEITNEGDSFNKSRFATKVVSSTVTIGISLDGIVPATGETTAVNNQHLDKKLEKLYLLQHRLNSEIKHPKTPENIKAIKKYDAYSV